MKLSTYNLKWLIAYAGYCLYFIFIELGYDSFFENWDLRRVAVTFLISPIIIYTCVLFSYKYIENWLIVKDIKNCFNFIYEDIKNNYQYLTKQNIKEKDSCYNEEITKKIQTENKKSKEETTHNFRDKILYIINQTSRIIIWIIIIIAIVGQSCEIKGLRFPSFIILIYVVFKIINKRRIKH